MEKLERFGSFWQTYQGPQNQFFSFFKNYDGEFILTFEDFKKILIVQELIK